MRFNYYSILGFIVATFLFVGIGNIASAQIKIGTNGSTIEPSSILELESNNQGLLLPRLTDTIAINTLSPPNGMLIYLTKWPAVGLYVRKTTGWEFLAGSLGGNGTFNNLTVGGTLTAQNFTGNLIGNASTATLSSTATNALNVNITNDLSTSTVAYPTFVTNTPGSQSIRTGSTNLSYVPNTGILTAKGFRGNLVGDVTGIATSSVDALNATNIQILEDDVNNNPVYPTFVTGKVGPLTATINSAKLQYLPATGEFTAPIFKGELQGNATTTTTATNAANVSVSDDSANASPTYPVFVNAITGNQALKSTSTFLSYVPSEGILTAKKFVGNLEGNISGQANSALSANNANNAINAVNSLNSTITDVISFPDEVYPTFVELTSGGNQAIKSNSINLKYLPSAGRLTAKEFYGNLTGDVTGRVSNAQQADNASNLEIGEVVPGVPTYYPALVSATTGQTAVKVNNSKLQYLPLVGELISPKFRGELIGNASSTSTADTASNVSITNDTSNPIVAYPVFVNSPTGNQGLKSSSPYLRYLPSSGILEAKRFVGNLEGNVTGEVTNAKNAVNSANISVSTDDGSTNTVYPVFVSALTGSLQPNVSTSRLGFKPLTGELNATTFKGDLIGNANTATSATTASNALNSAITDINSSVAGPFYPTFVKDQFDNQPIMTNSSKLKYDPSSGALEAEKFVGNLKGNVDGQATSALSAVSATNATTADNALKSEIIDDAISNSTETYPLFVNNSTGNQPLRSNGINLKYIPSSGTLKAKKFEGNLEGNLDGIATDAIDATNSANVAVTNDPASNSFKPLTFVDGNSGNLAIKVNGSKLTYNPSLSELKSDFFRGDLIGNAQTATTISPTGLVLPGNGGTGLSTYTPGSILYAENSNTLKTLPIGPVGAVLRVQLPAGAGAVPIPTWTLTGPGTVTKVEDGGTGRTSVPLGEVLVGNGNNTILSIGGSVGQVLRSNGPGALPSFQNAAGGDMILAGVQTVTGTKTFGTTGVSGVLQLAGIESGVTILNGPKKGISGIVTLPVEGDLVTQNGIETLTNKKLTSPQLTNPDIGNAVGATLKLGGGAILSTTNQSGTGDIVMSKGAILIAPNIGAATGSSLDIGSGTVTAANFVGNLINGSATLTDLTVNNPIVGDITGKASTVTTNANLTGEVTSNGNATTIENSAVISKVLTGYTSTTGLITASDNIVQAIGKLSGNIAASANATHTGDVEGATNLTIKDGAIKTSKIDASAVTFPKIQNISTNTVLGRATGGDGVVEQISTTGTGNVVRATSPTLVTPNIGAASATSLTVSGLITSTAPDGTAPFVVNSTTPVSNLSIGGNAATATLASTVTTNANLTGEVTSVGNATTVTNNAVISKVLTGFSSAAGVVAPTDNIVIAIGKLSGNIAANSNATHTGDVTGATALTISNNAVTTSKIANSAVTLDKIEDVATNTVLGRETAGTGVLEEISTIGTGNVVRANSPTLVTPILGAASATSLTVNGVITSNIADGNAPFVVTSTTPVTNLSVGGNAGSATKLATPRAINGVDFDGTGPININAPALTLTGNTLNPLITTSSLTSVGTLGALTVTNPIVGSVTGNASNVTGTVAIANGGTGATNQQTALNNLAGTQAAGRYLRSDGINTLLSTILAGDVPTLNQNTTGTAAGLNDAYIDWNAISGGKAILNKPTLNNGTVTSVAALTLGTSGTDLSSTVATNTSTPIITLNVPTASATNRGALSSADWTSFNAKQSALTFSTGLTNSSGTVTVNSTQNITNLSNLSTNGIVSTSGGTGALGITSVNGTGNVVLTSGANLVNPNIGSANGTSLTLTGSLTSTATTGTAPFVVSSSTPVANLNIGGNAATATKLATARTINGILFDGSADISVPATGLTAQYIDWDASSGATSIKNKPTITNGTVTSVAATVPSFLTITGSPITTNGTLAINYNTGTGLPVANGGTGLTSLTSGGALYASSANSIASGTLPTTAGGTGNSNYIVGDMLYASTTSALSRLPSAAAGNALISNGVGVAPSWGKIDLSTHILGTIPISLGGTGSSTQNFVDITTNQTIQGVKTFVEQISGSISGNAGGNAATATKLAATKTIYGNAFDGSANLDQVIAPAFGGTGSAFTRFVGPSVDVKTYTLPTTNATLARTDAAQSFSGIQTFNEPIVGSVTGNAATATTASALIASATINSPTLVTPILGTATANSINKVTITQPSSSATLTLDNGSTLATSGSNSITLTSTGPTNVTLPTSGMLVRAVSFEQTIDFPEVAAGTSQTISVGFAGTVSAGDVVSIGLPDELASAEGVFTVWVSGSNAVKIKFTNTSTDPIDLPDRTIKFKIFN